jgi:hypothetical protein
MKFFLRVCPRNSWRLISYLFLLLYFSSKCYYYAIISSGHHSKSQGFWFNFNLYIHLTFAG